MKVIDFEKKGNVVRFFLGDSCLRDYAGYKWNMVPYEHNADRVHEEFILGHKDIAFPFDSFVLEPCNGAYSSNSMFSKDDMKAEKVPCIIVVPKEIRTGSKEEREDFSYWAASDKVTRFYFNQEMEPSAESPAVPCYNMTPTKAYQLFMENAKKDAPKQYFEAVAYASNCMRTLETIRKELVNDDS